MSVANLTDDDGAWRPDFARYCVRCGGRLRILLLAGDTRARSSCRRCGHIHYENPRVLVSCLVTFESNILLCRRALNPAYGMWAPPGGFLEEGETLEEGAARETLEESGVRLDPDQLVFDRIRTLVALRQVHVSFRARVTAATCSAGPEALEARFLGERDVPWQQIAYPQIAADLRARFDELRTTRSDLQAQCQSSPWPCAQK